MLTRTKLSFCVKHYRRYQSASRPRRRPTRLRFHKFYEAAASGAGWGYKSYFHCLVSKVSPSFMPPCTRLPCTPLACRHDVECLCWEDGGVTQVCACCLASKLSERCVGMFTLRCSEIWCDGPLAHLNSCLKEFDNLAHFKGLLSLRWHLVAVDCRLSGYPGGPRTLCDHQPYAAINPVPPSTLRHVDTAHLPLCMERFPVQERRQMPALLQPQRLMPARTCRISRRQQPQLPAMHTLSPGTLNLAPLRLRRRDSPRRRPGK